MLTALSIRDIVLIDRLDLDFGAGLSVMTGETGAGKSILLDAFALALGARGDATLVRKGASQGQVSAEFELADDHPVFEVLSEAEVAPGEGLILRRVQASDGRTRAFINDQPVSAQLLRKVGAQLVEIHGQHDDRAMTDPAAHRKALDSFAGLGADAEDVASKYERWDDADAALADHREHISSVRKNADFLNHALAELQELAPEAEEEDVLSERRQVMMHAEKIADDLNEAYAALVTDGTSHDRVSAALRKLERQPPETANLLEPVTQALERVLIETNEARQQLEKALAETEFSPGELERVEDRLFALRALARKHSVPVSDLPALIGRFEAELDALDAGEQELAALEAAASAAAEAYRAAAQSLSEKRRAAAQRLDAAVMAELPPLKLEKATFVTRIDTCAPENAGPAGLDRVSFWVQTNPGTSPGPLMKVASGGELARFLLALKVVLAARGSAPTLIFDEIDTGVGGATASAIGERLSRLSKDLQVLAVTHAPQVAAHAYGHLRIAKEAVAESGDETVATRVIRLGDKERQEEIARMLAGQTVTEEARAAARRLIGGQS